MTETQTKKTVRTFAFASFLNDLGADMISPLWPLFLTGVLGADMIFLGLIDGLGEAVVSISQAVSGYISDKIRKRKIFIWLGYFFASLARIGYVFSRTAFQILPFRLLDRAGKIRDAPRDAMVADLSVHENRGGHFGFIRAMDNLGAVFGILIALLFFEALGYRNLFLLAAIPSAIGALLVLKTVPEKNGLDGKIYPGLHFKDIDWNCRLFLFLSAIFALGSFSYSFLLLYSRDLGFSIGFVPILYLIFTFIASLFSMPAGVLSDRFGRKPVLMLAYLFWGLVGLAFLFVKDLWAIPLIFVFYGLHKGTLETVQRTFVAELAPLHYRASVLGGFQMIIGLCALPASLVAGILWEKFGAVVPFYFSLGLTVLAMILLLFVKEKNVESKNL